MLTESEFRLGARHRTNQRRLAKRKLITLSEATGAGLGIAWLRKEDGQLVWLADLGIKHTDFDCESRFAQDILENVSEAFSSEECQLFGPCDESVFQPPNALLDVDLTEKEANDLSRALVLGHFQIMIPVVEQKLRAVVSLFLKVDDPVALDWHRNLNTTDQAKLIRVELLLSAE